MKPRTTFLFALFAFALMGIVIAWEIQQRRHFDRAISVLQRLVDKNDGSNRVEKLRDIEKLIEHPIDKLGEGEGEIIGEATFRGLYSERIVRVLILRDTNRTVKFTVRLKHEFEP